MIRWHLRSLHVTGFHPGSQLPSGHTPLVLLHGAWSAQWQTLSHSGPNCPS